MARTAHSARKATAPQSKGKSSSQAGSQKSLSPARPAPGGKTAPRKPLKQLPPAKPTKSLSVRTPVISQEAKPKKTRSSKNVLKEIKYYQANIGFLMPKAGLVKLVRHIMATAVKGVPSEGVRFTSNSLAVVHEALENHLVCQLELAYMAARHAKRVTLFPSDIRLINRIKMHV